MSNEFFEEQSKTAVKKPVKRPSAPSSQFSLPKKSKIGKKIAAVLVVIILFAGVIYFSFDYAVDAFIHSRREVPVPDVKGKTPNEALNIMYAPGLALKKAGEETSALPPGSITRQLPSAGSIVREGRVIRVWLSQSETDIELPVLTGLTLNNAQLLVRQSGLVTGDVQTAFSTEFDKGAVSDQTPKAGEFARRGAVVNLTVSDGPPPVDVLLMPELRFKKLTEASQWASKNDIDIETTEDKDSAYPAGFITDQKPDADTQVKPGDTIQITVSARSVAGEGKTYRVYYEMAQGKKNSNLRITFTDADGNEKDIINELKKPGSKIELDVPYGGDGKIRIYVDGILVREREVKL